MRPRIVGVSLTAVVLGAIVVACNRDEVEIGRVEAIDLTNKLLNNVEAHVVENPAESTRHWLTLEPVIEFAAKEKPEEVLALIEPQIRLWRDYGFYVGDLPRIFGAYRLIGDEKLKAQVKERLQAWHKEFQSINPKVPDATWE